jgi:hypothetical protein
MKKLLYIFLLLFLFNFTNTFSQVSQEFKEKLTAFHGIQNQKNADDIWIYDDSHHKIEKVNSKIYSNLGIETYLVEMTWKLGYHRDEVNCLFSFNPSTNEIKFMPELWCKGYSKEFLVDIIGYDIQNQKKFVKDFEDLLQLNNPKLKLEKVYYDKRQTTMYQSRYLETKKLRDIWRIIVLQHSKNGKLIQINVLRPDGKKALIIK